MADDTLVPTISFQLERLRRGLGALGRRGTRPIGGSQTVRRCGNRGLRAGEIVFVDFDSYRGHEPSKYRPALVLSATDFNDGAATTVLCSITTSDTGYPFHVYVDSGETAGYACVEQMKALDLGAKRCKRAGWADAEGMDKALSLMGVFLR